MSESPASEAALVPTQREHADPRPAVSRDPAFHGMLLTQFLGAFNDNLFKQLVLLLCIDFKASGGGDYQPVALALFAIPFVMFSGYAGFLSDRNSKRMIVVLAKIGEVVIMALGLSVFFATSLDPGVRLTLLFVVLALMSTQSAFFGPAKYGILPELFRDRDLPAVNGLIQMTTFVAIIFGMALAGYAKDWLGLNLWWLSLASVGIAVVGTVASLLIRRTPVAEPGLRFSASALGINTDTWQMLKRDRPLLVVLGVSSLFWFSGGLVQPAVNEFGRLQLGLSDGRTSLLAACMGIGIAIGCVLGGALSKRRIEFRLVTCGAWGIVACLMSVGVVGWIWQQGLGIPADPEPLSRLIWPRALGEGLARLALTGLGVFAGLFVVPLQVFLQTRPPDDQKGRMIGTMNLINWIGIMGSAGFLFAGLKVLSIWKVPAGGLFPLAGLLMVPVAWRFRAWMGDVSRPPVPERTSDS